jgi:hypothetical protein
MTVAANLLPGRSKPGRARGRVTVDVTGSGASPAAFLLSGSPPASGAIGTACRFLEGQGEGGR